MAHNLGQNLTRNAGSLKTEAPLLELSQETAWLPYLHPFFFLRLGITLGDIPLGGAPLLQTESLLIHCG